MKTISILLALMNSLAAGLVIVSSLPAIQPMHVSSAVWQIAKILVAMLIIAAGILTWIAASRWTMNPNLVLFAGLFLVALGSASAMWTIHIALVSGHIKDYLFLFGGSMIMQGSLSIWDLFLLR
jgi:hypothetical protein